MRYALKWARQRRRLVVAVLLFVVTLLGLLYVVGSQVRQATPPASPLHQRVWGARVMPRSRPAYLLWREWPSAHFSRR